MNVQKVVAIGGGHGLPIVLKSVRDYARDIVAVATVADDGGSSGRLREELDILPPGDSRNCLVALANGDLFTQLFQYRFPRGEGIAGHALGNLLIAALTDMTGDFGEALNYAGRLLGVRGRVLPPTKEKVTLCAEVEPKGIICGQCNIANRLRRLKSIWLEPKNPPANRETVESIIAADQIIIGPGSLFTSVMPNLLVPEIGRAVAQAKAQRVFVCNTMIQPGETDGFTVADHLDAFSRHLDSRIVDVMIVNQSTFSRDILDELADRKIYPVPYDRERVAKLGVDHVVADVANLANPTRHEGAKLGKVLAELADHRVKS